MAPGVDNSVPSRRQCQDLTLRVSTMHKLASEGSRTYRFRMPGRRSVVRAAMFTDQTREGRMELIAILSFAGLFIWGAAYCVTYVTFHIVGELGEHFRGECGCYRDRNGV